MIMGDFGAPGDYRFSETEAIVRLKTELDRILEKRGYKKIV